MPARPVDADSVDARRVAETDEHSWIVGGRVAAVGSGPAPERRTGRANDRHSRAEHVARAWRPDDSLSPTQCLRLPMWLISSRIGPLSLPTTTSVSPSLSMSPNAAPRLDLGHLSKTAPAWLGDVLELPVAEIAEQLFRLLQ